MFLNSSCNINNSDLPSQMKTSNELETDYPVLFIKNATENCSNKNEFNECFFSNIKNVKLISSFKTSYGLIGLRLFDKTNVDKVKSELNVKVFGEESIILDPLERKDVYFSVIAKDVPT